MSLDFENDALKGNELVLLVADELKVSQDEAGRVIRAVLHALRNRLTHEESFQLLAQLPMALKGVYVDGWKFDKDFGSVSHLNDFPDEVDGEDGGLSAYDFANRPNAMIAIVSVFKALNYIVSEEEMDHIIGVLPKEVKKLINNNISGDGTIL